jgi:hypothetical protein
MNSPDYHRVDLMSSIHSYLYYVEPYLLFLPDTACWLRTCSCGVVVSFNMNSLLLHQSDFPVPSPCMVMV